jgi:pyrimidine deaminase RibD-like protein
VGHLGLHARALLDARQDAAPARRASGSGVQRVVVGELDPDPRHQGIGLRLLQEHGVKVELVGGPAPLEHVAPQFLA